MNLTRGQLINIGLKSAEATGLKPDISRLLLNLSIQFMATNFRFEHLKKTFPNPANPGETFTLVSGQNKYALPSDYGRSAALKIFTGQMFVQLTQSDEEDWYRDRYNFDLNPSGQPTKFLLTDELDETQNPQNARKHFLLINKSPDKDYNATLSYYRMPIWYDPNNSSHDGKTIPFDDNILLEMFKYHVYDHMSDKRAEIQLAKANSFIRDYLIYNSDNSIMVNKIKLDPNVYRKRVNRL